MYKLICTHNYKAFHLELIQIYCRSLLFLIDFYGVAMTQSPFLRSHLQSIAGYRPGEQPPPGCPVIKLNTNENPYPPSPKVFDALAQIDGEILRRYPDASAQQFREAASEVFDIPADWITVANGSDDLLSLVMRAFVEPGAAVVYPWPTYVLYQTLVELHDARAIALPFDDSFALPVEALIAAQGVLTLIAAPASPSGTEIPLSQLFCLAQELSGVLVIDEAYVDFAETSALEIVRNHRNVLLLRTLSKGYSLAGLRLGFAMAHPEIIQGLNKIKDSYSVDAIACRLGTAALQDQGYKTEIAQKVKRSRAWLAAECARLGCRVWPSVTNFLLVQPPCGDVYQLMLDLKARQVYTRYFDLPGLSNKLRITVGTDEQNAKLSQHLAELLSA